MHPVAPMINPQRPLLLSCDSVSREDATLRISRKNPSQRADVATHTLRKTRSPLFRSWRTSSFPNVTPPTRHSHQSNEGRPRALLDDAKREKERGSRKSERVCWRTAHFLLKRGIASRADPGARNTESNEHVRQPLSLSHHVVVVATSVAFLHKRRVRRSRRKGARRMQKSCGYGRSKTKPQAARKTKGHWT